MNIAITCENTEITGLVPKLFKNSNYLMIIDADTNQIYKIYGKQDPENMVFAEKVLEHDCEAIICGALEKAPFELLAGNGVTRYDGSCMKVQRAYDYMHRYQLKWISEYIGGPGVHEHSHDGECEGDHEHEDEK